jgi:hypothetical protein
MTTTPLHTGTLELPNVVGQWIGHSEVGGRPKELSLANIEKRDPSQAQLVGASSDDHRIRTSSDAKLIQDGDSIKGATFNYRVFDQQSDQFVPLADHFQKIGIKERPPEKANYSAEFDGRRFSGEFTNDLGQQGQFEYWRTFSEALLGKEAPPTDADGQFDWKEFKEYIAKFCRYEDVLFRGQHSNKYPLRTTFHRAHRNNLVRYVEEDVPRLRHRINAVSPHYYNSAGEDFLGLLSLAQHHGYPTPLLDWTLSPYIAAFFAFDCMGGEAEWAKRDGGPVRILVFEQEKWRKFARPMATSLKDPWPDLQFVHPPAHNNPRYYPQQSIAAFSNLDDIEGFITAFEMKHETKCLHRLDIHSDQRPAVLDDLRFMGITPATLFPGVEGICRFLRTTFF